MKTTLLISALGLMISTAACHKEEVVQLTAGTDTEFAPLPSDRCGCLAPVKSTSSLINGVDVEIEWNPMPETANYVVEIAAAGRRIDAIDDILLRQETSENSVLIRNLAPRTIYKYRLSSICGNGLSDTAEWVSFKTGDEVHGDPGYQNSKPLMGRKSADN